MAMAMSRSKASDQPNGGQDIPKHKALTAPGGPTSAGGETAIPLAALHKRRVAVHCSFLGREVTIVGQGIYERDPELGQVLRIDPSHGEQFQLTFVEKSWNGDISAGKSGDWDYLIRLFN
jgi:hypothetical protein